MEITSTYKAPANWGCSNQVQLRLSCPIKTRFWDLLENLIWNAPCHFKLNIPETTLIPLSHLSFRSTNIFLSQPNSQLFLILIFLLLKAYWFLFSFLSYAYFFPSLICPQHWCYAADLLINWSSSWYSLLSALIISHSAWITFMSYAQKYLRASLFLLS